MNIYNQTELDFLIKRLHEDSWYLDLPEDVKKLVDKYPPGTYWLYEGRIVYVVGYTEGKNGEAIGLKMSKWHPMKEYYEAINDSFYVCNDCLEKHILKSCAH